VPAINMQRDSCLDMPKACRSWRAHVSGISQLRK